jgi:phage FluMu protein Com
MDPYGESVPEVERLTRHNVRCASCGRLLAELVTAPWRVKCSRCKALNASADHVLRPTV